MQHDRYYLIPIHIPIILTFFWLVLITLGIRETRHRFKRKLPLKILLMNTGLTLITTGLVLYGLYIVGILSGLTGFISSKKHGFYDSVNSVLFAVELTAAILLPLLLAIAIFFIWRLWALRKNK